MQFCEPIGIACGVLPTRARKLILNKGVEYILKLSICIPTYNRAEHLDNCLHSIANAAASGDFAFEVCISDNCSTDETKQVVTRHKVALNLRYHCNDSNLGIPRNFLQVVSMAGGDFVWLIGDDDLLMPYALERMIGLIEKNPDVDFFYANSFHLNAEYLDGFSAPFDVKYLPKDMEPFSLHKTAGTLPFFDLIDPRISFDFLGGMFLSVFRRQNWDAHTSALDPAAIKDMRAFSHFDNTFPHVKIWSEAFAHSKAYFNPTPLNVCLTGVREWSALYPLISSVRLIEALDAYRDNGLPLWRYLYCRNFALRTFAPDVLSMLLYKQQSGYEFVNLGSLFVKNSFYPNTYLSLPIFIWRRVKRLLQKILSRNIGR